MLETPDGVPGGWAQRDRSVPILFEPVEVPVKPGRRAGKKEWAIYKKAKKKNMMCDQAFEHMRTLRKVVDEIGAVARVILYTLDGGFCNAKIFKAKRDRCFVLARCRRDAKLCFSNSDPAHPKKRFAAQKFTPESVRKNEGIRWQSGQFFIGGPYRKIRYKEVRDVLWQRGAGLKLLPAFIVASYSFLLLASLEAYGAKRTDAYLRPPKWQRRRSRPSCLDLLALLRKEALEHPERLKTLDTDFDASQTILKAAA